MKVNVELIPESLKHSGLFCLWKYEQRDGGKRTKVPYNPNRPDTRAESDNRATFSDFSIAAAQLNDFDGIGIGIFDDIAGIDIDDCIVNGELSAMALDIVQTMRSYTEVSPSGHGVRIIFRARDFVYDSTAYYIKNNKIGLEIYLPGMTRRYLTITGNTNPEAINEPQPRADELQKILDRYMKRPAATQSERQQPTQPLTLSDSEIIAKAAQAKNGEQFKALWSGIYATSHSEADLALCNLLAYWTQRDPAAIDRIFRSSALMREKWDERRGAQTYGANTIDKAIAGCAKVYDPHRAPERPSDAPGAVGIEKPVTEAKAPEKATQSATESEAPTPAPNSVKWFDSFLEKVQTDAYKPIKTGMAAFDRLLRGGIPAQSLVILSAAPGTGKTTLAQQIFETAATQGTDVIFLNLEMSREQLLSRSLSRLIHQDGGNISASEIMRGYSWSDAQRRYIESAAQKYRERIAPHMAYNPGTGGTTLTAIMDILTKAAEQARTAQHSSPVCVLDYLHLVTAEGREEQGEIIKRTVAALKRWAIEYNTFVLAISANSRAANNSSQITNDAGRDTSAIEYTADIQLSLNYRAIHEGKVKPSNADEMEKLYQEKPRRMLCQVLKNRMSEPGGKLYLNFDAANSLFTPVETNIEAPAAAAGFTEVVDNEIPFI